MPGEAVDVCTVSCTVSGQQSWSVDLGASFDLIDPVDCGCFRNRDVTVGCSVHLASDCCQLCCIESQGCYYCALFFESKRTCTYRIRMS